MGVYDIMNENFNERDFKPSSSEPVVRIKGMKDEHLPSDEEDSSSSGDSNLYYEFNSDEGEASEQMSSTTKSTSTAAQGRRPMIVDITLPV